MMKKIIKILYFSLIIILLKSCTLEKRLHQPGYFVKWNKNYSSPLNQKNEEEDETISKKENKEFFQEEKSVTETEFIVAKDFTTIVFEDLTTSEQKIISPSPNNINFVQKLGNEGANIFVQGKGIGFKNIYTSLTKVEQHKKNKKFHWEYLLFISLGLMIIGLILVTIGILITLISSLVFNNDENYTNILAGPIVIGFGLFFLIWALISFIYIKRKFIKPKVTNS